MTEVMSWKLVWDYNNGKTAQQTFADEDEALAFVERVVDSDPNVSGWVIISQPRKVAPWVKLTHKLLLEPQKPA